MINIKQPQRIIKHQEAKKDQTTKANRRLEKHVPVNTFTLQVGDIHYAKQSEITRKIQN